MKTRDGMKICLLTGYYDPEIAAETHLLLDLTNDFVRYGAHVTVITSFPTRGLDGHTRAKYAKMREEITENGIMIRRVGVKFGESNGFLLRTLRYILISWSIYRSARSVRPDVYLVTSTPPFLGIVGGLLSRVKPTVYNLQDLFPDSLIFTKRNSQKSLVVKLLKRSELYTYRKNTHILTISEDFKNNILKKGVENGKISIVRNWIDVNRVIPVDKSENRLFKKYNLDPDLFYVTYCGNIGYSQNLEMVVDVAKRIEYTCPDIRFILIGDGAWLTNLRDYIRLKKCRNTTILPFQPYEMISEVYSLGDISLVVSRKGVSVGSVPSKTWSIMSAERTVLCSFDEESDLCKIIKQAGCGICVPPEDDRSFEESLLMMYHNKDMIRELGKKGRFFVRNYLNREKGTQEYFKILKREAKIT